jgi:hypothetical protein
MVGGRLAIPEVLTASYMKGFHVAVSEDCLESPF